MKTMLHQSESAFPMSGKKENDRKLRREAVDWLLRLQDNPDDPILEAHLEAWLRGDPARRIVYDRARRAVGDARHLLSSDPEFARKAAHRRAIGARGMIVILGLCLAGSGTFYLADGPMRLQADIVSEIGKPVSVTLADGSTVELNAHSAIAIDMADHQRRITLLRGEAYFRVAADPSRPFVVEAGRGTTTALGTAFDVNLTTDGARVVVTEHAVQVGSSMTGEAQKIMENHQLSYDVEGHLGAVTPADLTATAWRDGRLAFEDQPLARVVEEITRYLPGKIIIARPALAERRISGSLDLTAPKDALDGFADAIGINITRIGPYLTILR